MPPTQAQFLGSMLGLAVGDAVGAPFEGLPGWMIHKQGPAIRIVKTPTEETRYYTDDTQMAIGVAETLVECGEIREEELCAAFARNYDPVRCYGQGARRLIEAMIAEGDWRELARTIFPGGSLGNGAAMRVAPMGLLFCDNLDRVAEQAELSARPTHLHPLAIESARLLALAVALAVREPNFDRIKFFEELHRRAQTEEFQWQMSTLAQLLPDDSVAGFGSTLEAHRSVGTAIACFASSPDSYTETISHAIGLGDDTDTLAAMAGAISGARLGIYEIPQHLIASLENSHQGREYIEKLAARLYQKYLENESPA
jgi:poly(ADP-ribose) glycohydrolase ARH3